MKTLVKLFDKCQIKNVAAAIKYKPGKVIFVGYKQAMTKKRIADTERFFAMRNENINTCCETVNTHNMGIIINMFKRLAAANDDVYFDLTGGSETLIAAMGAAAQECNIPVLRMNIKNGASMMVWGEAAFQEADVPEIKINECIALSGGLIVETSGEGFKFDEEFRKDTELMWNICRQNCTAWNRQTRIFAEAEMLGEVSGLRVTVDLGKLAAAGYDTVSGGRIIKKLSAAGIIKKYEIRKNILSFEYKNYDVRRCMGKSGNILELHTYLTAEKIPQVSDVAMGVTVDWDGVIQPEGRFVKETRNEIDVVLMKKIMPVFISCKSGEIKKEALYELDTVANKFGGGNVKKLLVATHICSDPDSRRYFLQRARDMQIYVIEDVDMLSNKDFEKKLSNIINN